MTTSQKKPQRCDLWGFCFVYHLDTISFLATVSIAYSDSLFKYSMSTIVLHPVNIRNTDVNICITSCQLSYYRCLQLYCILSAFVLQMSTTVLHLVSFRITDVYNCIASCQLSYYRCLQLYCILSAFVLHLVYICIT